MCGGGRDGRREGVERGRWAGGGAGAQGARMVTPGALRHALRQPIPAVKLRTSFATSTSSTQGPAGGLMSQSYGILLASMLVLTPTSRMHPHVSNVKPLATCRLRHAGCVTRLSLRRVTLSLSPSQHPRSVPQFSQTSVALTSPPSLPPLTRESFSP